LREMLRLPNVSTHWRPDDFNGVSEAIEKLSRPRKRLTELMLKSLNEQPAQPKCTKQFLPIFLRSPKTLKEQELIFTINEMQQDRAVATSSLESLPADLVLRSIGYKSSCADKELCFDARAGMVANVNGRVLKNANDTTSVDPGLYTAGWLATGPTGVILTTMNVAFSVAKTICDDVAAKKISTEDSRPGLMDLLKDKRYVNWQAWERIDAEETKRGQAIGKPREKIVSVEDMLKVAGL
ncbi:NADPH:adrenodoxin oxidoreductase, mitochondrial-like, partial [Musca vetustissima]|uniref:NADPH:adrenodoxin oxidoreductase, mitochondrial-like n=1 Tax=Musca vetustissima TaxID=27455 RepID=UPI002AB6079E